MRKKFRRLYCMMALKNPGIHIDKKFNRMLVALGLLILAEDIYFFVQIINSEKMAMKFLMSLFFICISLLLFIIWELWVIKDYKYLKVSRGRTVHGCFVAEKRDDIINDYWKAFQIIQQDYAGKKLKTDTHAIVIGTFLKKSKEDNLLSFEEADRFLMNNRKKKPSKMRIELANGSVVKIKYHKMKKNALKIVSYMDSDIRNMSDEEVQKMYKDITGKCKYYKVEIEVPNER